MLSLTIRVYLHSFTCCCLRNMRNPAKFSENSNYSSSRSSILVSIESSYQSYATNFLLVINSNHGRISYPFQDIDAYRSKIACFPHPSVIWRSQCRLTGHCTVMPLSTCGSLHQSPTSGPDKDFGLPPRTICAFLPSDCLLLDVVLSLSLALEFGTLFLPTSLQHLLCSLSENV